MDSWITRPEPPRPASLLRRLGPLCRHARLRSPHLPPSHSHASWVLAESWDPRGRHATSLITRGRAHYSASLLSVTVARRPGLPLPLILRPPPLNLHSPCLWHEPIRWHGAAVTCRWLALVVRTCCSGRLPWTWWRRGVLAASDGGAAMEAVQTVRDLIRLFLVSSILSHARVDMSRHLAAWLIIPLFVCVGTWSYLLLSALFAYWWFNNCLLFNFNVI